MTESTILNFRDMRRSQPVAEETATPVTSVLRALGKASEVAAALRTTPAALAQMRYRGDGPPFFRLGRRILYRWEDVEQWITDSQRTQS
jgi:hypothetical protein